MDKMQTSTLTSTNDRDSEVKVKEFKKNTVGLPSVRTTIHWMPSPKDLWLSGTHLHDTQSVRHEGRTDLKLYDDAS